MLTQTEKLNVLHHDHLVVRDVERRSIQNVIHILVIATGEKLECLFKTFRRLAQSFATWIFADQPDDLPHVTGNALVVVRYLGVEKYFFAFAIGRLGHVSAPW